MKSKMRPMLFLFCLLFIFCFSAFCALSADNTKSVMDMIPYDSLAYVSLSDLDVVYDLVLESPEWQELMDMESLAEDLEKGNQAVKFLPMLLGITVEEFFDVFGHKMAASFMGMKDNMPMAGLVADISAHKETAEYAVEQTATIPALAGGAMIEEKEYRDVAYTLVGNKSLKVSYGFLGDFLLAGINGGFERLVDIYKDGGKSIAESPNYQFMGKKISPSNNIYAYVDLEQLAPFLQGMLNANKKDKEENPQEMMTNLTLESSKAFALGLSLSGHTQEVYLHLKAKESNPITDLLLAPQSPMSAVNLIPFDDGLLLGIHLGDPADLLDKGLKLAESFGKKPDDVGNGIKQIEGALGINLRDDLLSALTGEISVMATVPEGQLDTANKLQMYMQMAKTKQAVLIGVRDEKKLGETTKKLLELAKVKTMPLKEDSYKGTTIHTEVVPLETLAPGLALMPAYAFKDNLLIMSGSEMWVKEAIDLVESLDSAEIRDKLAESRVLIYLDAGGIAQFAGKALEQGAYKNIEIPETIQSKLNEMGSIAASLSWGQDGVGIKLISASEDVWATKILRGVLVGIYSDKLFKEKVEAPGEMEMPDEGEMQEETKDESQKE